MSGQIASSISSREQFGLDLFFNNIGVLLAEKGVLPKTLAIATSVFQNLLNRLPEECEKYICKRYEKGFTCSAEGDALVSIGLQDKINLQIENVRTKALQAFKCSQKICEGTFCAPEQKTFPINYSLLSTGSESFQEKLQSGGVTIIRNDLSKSAGGNVFDNNGWSNSLLAPFFIEGRMCEMPSFTTQLLTHPLVLGGLAGFGFFGYQAVKETFLANLSSSEEEERRHTGNMAVASLITAISAALGYGGYLLAAEKAFNPPSSICEDFSWPFFLGLRAVGTIYSVGAVACLGIQYSKSRGSFTSSVNDLES